MSVGIRPENIVIENLSDAILVPVKADLIGTMGMKVFFISV